MADNAVQTIPSLQHAASLQAPPRQVCVRCIMDTSDPDIRFDREGLCSHCHGYAEIAARLVHSGEAGRRQLDGMAAEIRARGRGKQYDCVMGVSGGVDSTYVASVAKSLGLRPLAVHLDNGWNSELAVSNIEKVLRTLEIDLFTEVLDWEEFRDLQLSFLRASVPDAEIPTDHAISATVNRVAAQRGIGFIISGDNVVTEGILPTSWTYGVWDWKYISAVHQRYGTARLASFPHYSLARMFYYKSVKKIRTVRPLNYVPYVKGDVMRVLEDKLGWKYYGGKHYESIYTRFFQGYILPLKFGIDKRKAHLSTLICSGQMTREEAIAEMLCDRYAGELQQSDREYVIKKLALSREEFARIMALPARSYRDFPNSSASLRRGIGVVRAARRLRLLPASPV